MRHVAIRRVADTDRSIVAALGSHGVATVHEAMNRSGLMRPTIRPIFEGAQLAGRAITVLATAGDNWMIHAALELCDPGDVLVVGVTTDSSDGMVGDLLASMMMAQGVAGLVIDAGCRDVRRLREMRFPVWSRAISAQGTVKNSLGSINMPVACGGALVRPGDIIVADDDGVVVVPRERAGEIAAAADERSRSEERLRQRMAAEGFKPRLSHEMRTRMIELGMTWIDDAGDDTDGGAR
jgi:4-hydroxy-4-methyl-2-oxoglutarate aldolase